jgi:hypothetical protein
MWAVVNWIHNWETFAIHLECLNDNFSTNTLFCVQFLLIHRKCDALHEGLYTCITRMPQQAWSSYLRQTVFSVRYRRRNFVIEADSVLCNVKSDAEEIDDRLIFSIRCIYCNSEIATYHVTRHNTSICNILSTAPQLSISQKALGTLPEDGNVMPKRVGATIHN